MYALIMEAGNTASLVQTEKASLANLSSLRSMFLSRHLLELLNSVLVLPCVRMRLLRHAYAKETPASWAAPRGELHAIVQCTSIVTLVLRAPLFMSFRRTCSFLSTKISARHHHVLEEIREGCKFVTSTTHQGVLCCLLQGRKCVSCVPISSSLLSSFFLVSRK